MSINMKHITQAPVITSNNDMILSAPITVHIELTSGCNLKCRHCYNYWRHKSVIPAILTRQKLDFLLKEIITNGIMHVIFTGGEPFLNYDNLLHGIKRLTSANVSVSCNSNLFLATPQRMKELKDAGLNHILTSLNSYEPKTNDFMVSKPGAFKQTVKGIKTAIASGVRISANMIVTKRNIRHIYKTAGLAASLGAKKFFATRIVPNVSKNIDAQKEFLLQEEEVKIVLNELLKAGKDFGLQVGSLVSFPLCFLKDLDKYKEFYMHGCPAGNKMLSINADGKTHACVHEEESYGSVFEIGIRGAWRNMYRLWQKGEAFPPECKQCALFDKCNSGCPLIGRVIYGKYPSYDILRRGWKKVNKTASPRELPSLKGRKFYMAEGLRFRKEDSAYVFDSFGSEIVLVKEHLARILMKYYRENRIFSSEDVSRSYQNEIKSLIARGFIKVKEINKNPASA